MGSTIGPFLGGVLVIPSFFAGYSLPFWVGGLFCFANLILIVLYFRETNIRCGQTVKLSEALLQMKKMFSMKAIRFILVTIFVYIFGWSFYYEFIPLYLIQEFHFDASQIGYFYAYSTGWYAIAAGFLTMPLFKKFKLESILLCALIGLGVLIFSFLLIPNFIFLAFYLPFQSYFSALIFPTSTSIVSNSVPKESQGEALGVFQSVQALAWGLAPLFSGPLLCIHNAMPIFVGGTAILLASMIFGLQESRKLKTA